MKIIGQINNPLHLEILGAMLETRGLHELHNETLLSLKSAEGGDNYLLNYNPLFTLRCINIAYEIEF